MYDVLNIAKEKKYMVLDPVSQESNDSKAITALVIKKKVKLIFVKFDFNNFCLGFSFS